jgi:hypothetical protein
MKCENFPKSFLTIQGIIKLPGFSFCVIIFFALIIHINSHAQRLSRDLNVDILVNHAGYLPNASKTCVVPGVLERKFEVRDVASNEIVFSGTLKPGPSDLGAYLAGDFSGVTREGRYYVKADTLRSYPFSISGECYRVPMDLIVQYFSKQRCGPSTTGYLTPCHIDDGVRMDNGKHQDATGGWHDASDLRKWISATIYGMIGLGKKLQLHPNLNRGATIDELRWGNRYFLAMQEPQGYVMNYIGGDVKKHSDSNRWTDNEEGPEGGELAFVKPNTGKSTADMLLMGTKDDRVIRTDALEGSGQYNFILAEALMAGIMKNEDPAYSAKCLDAAVRCFNWSLKEVKMDDSGTIGAAMLAALELFKVTGQDTYKTFVKEQAVVLKKLQAPKSGGGISGFYFHSAPAKEPYKNIWNGCEELIALCDMVKMFPADRDVSLWKEIISNYSRDYLMTFTRRNSFGIVPFGLFTGNDPGGSRKIGDYWYRYFMQPESEWWVGVNANLASSGIGFLKAAEALDDLELRSYAQKQLDWIIGVNPFNSSTMAGVGYNHPRHFAGSTFIPNTPIIPGAVVNGLGGDHDDMTVIGNGNWQISEYWTPMVAYTLWLMAELSVSE